MVFMFTFGLRERKANGVGSLLLRTFVGVVILLILLYFVEPVEIAVVFKEANLLYLIAALLLIIPNIGFQVLKWRLLLQCLDKSASTKAAFNSVLFGLTLGSVTPARLGEFAGRAVSLQSYSKSAIIGMTLLDKMQIMALISIGGIISSLYFVGARSWEMITPAIAVSIPLAYLSLVPSKLENIFHFLRLSKLEKPWLIEFFQSLTTISAKVINVSFALSFLFYLTIYVQFYFLLNAFDSVGPWTAFIGFSATMFYKSLLPISVGDLGIREAAAVWFFSKLGVQAAVAFNASLLLATINIFLPAIIGAAFVPKSFWRMKHEEKESPPSSSQSLKK